MTMSSLVSTAAAAAAVIPFHCVICFDAFSSKNKYPVVLPCGHTYVCNPCARRLRRCMECREPLFINAALKNPHVHAPANGNTSARGGPPLYPQGRYQAPSSPMPPGAVAAAQQAEPIALPLPKNLVLMSMMEAAESQTRIQEEEEEDCINPERMSNDEVANEDDNDDDEYDSNKIISGIVSFSGPCGTYVVRDANGLAVLPCHPEKGCQQLDTDREHRLNSEGRIEPFTIFQGQTVQVVNFNDGVAKLARGAGFIVASSSQLVKVGAPLDRCCRLEGMVETLSLRGQDLQIALSENEQLEAHLKTKVEKEVQKSPEKPVISAAPDKPSDGEHLMSASEEPKAPSSEISGYENPLLIPGSPQKFSTSETSDSCGLEVSENRRLLYPDVTTRLPPSPNSIDNSEFNRCEVNAPGMPRYRRNTEDDMNLFAGCGSSLFVWEEAEQGVGLSFDSMDSVTPRPHNSVRGEQGSSSSPSRPLHPMLSSSFDNVDWRTGMSGHRALSKNTSPRATITRNVRLMSEHRGIGAGRTASRNSNSPSSSPASAPPQFIAPSEYGDPMLH